MVLPNQDTSTSVTDLQYEYGFHWKRAQDKLPYRHPHTEVYCNLHTKLFVLVSHAKNHLQHTTMSLHHIAFGACSRIARCQSDAVHVTKSRQPRQWNLFPASDLPNWVKLAFQSIRGNRIQQWLQKFLYVHYDKFSLSIPVSTLKQSKASSLFVVKWVFQYKVSMDLLTESALTAVCIKFHHINRRHSEQKTVSKAHISSKEPAATSLYRARLSPYNSDIIRLILRSTESRKCYNWSMRRVYNNKDKLVNRNLDLFGLVSHGRLQRRMPQERSWYWRQPPTLFSFGNGLHW